VFGSEGETIRSISTAESAAESAAAESTAVAESAPESANILDEYARGYGCDDLRERRSRRR